MGNERLEKLFKREESDANKKIPVQSNGYFSSQSVLIKNICESLNSDSSKYDPNETLRLLAEYSEQNTRILYSEISSYIFTLKNDNIGQFMTNLMKMVESSEYSNVDNDVVFKFYDHIQLAFRQNERIIKSDFDLEEALKEKSEKIRADFSSVIENSKKEVSSQLIALVGIFTGLAFLIFGGISSLDNIFQGVQTLPVLKLMIIGCVWGICIINLIFVFMYFVSKITGTNIKTNLRKDANFVQRYPFICWGNAILVFLLAVCGWCYFIQSYNVENWFIELSRNCQIVISVLGFVVIAIIFSIIAYCINKSCKEF